MTAYVKRSLKAPPGFFACEAAGLRWLGSVEAGVPCAAVIGHDATSLTLERLDRVTPDRSAAYEFGRRLARTHDAGAAAFGSAPDGWTGRGFFGPLNQPLPMTFANHLGWGGFYAAERLAPMAERAAPSLGRAVRDGLERVLMRCARGDFDDDEQPARLHGDLWNGNVMWTSGGVVLIDPAAHGGHRETDLAMLRLFGCPLLDVVLEGYHDEHALRDGWLGRVWLHQLHPLLAHLILFGPSYAGAVDTAIAATLSIDD